MSEEKLAGYMQHPILYEHYSIKMVLKFSGNEGGAVPTDVQIIAQENVT